MKAKAVVWVLILGAAIVAGCSKAEEKPSAREPLSPLTVPYDEAAESGVESLMAHLDEFQLQIRYYHGPSASEVHHRHLWLLAGGPPPTTPAWIVVSGVEAGVARRIISHLADSGFFGRALDLTKVSMGPPIGPCYHLFLSAGDGARYVEDLGWGPEMRVRLWALRKILEGDAARAMDKLLKQLAEREAMERLRPKFTPRERLERAQKAFGERRWDDSLVEAKEALVRASGLEEVAAYRLLGDAFKIKGDLRNALAMYRRALEIGNQKYPKGPTSALVGPGIRAIEARLANEARSELPAEVAWGRLVDDSLQMGLTCKRGLHESGARMDFTVHVRNAGRKVSRAVADPEDPSFWKNCRPTFSPAGGGTPIVAPRIGEVGESYKIRDVRFAPGEERAARFLIEKGRWHFHEQTRVRRGGKRFETLPPGKYTVTVNVGYLTSGLAEIEIAVKGGTAKDSATDVERGPSVTVKPAKPVFARKEPLAFDVTFTNVSDKPFMLFDVDFYQWWRYEFTAVEGAKPGQNWTGFCSVMYRRVPPEPVELRPGASRVVRATVAGQLMFRPGDARGKDAIRLPAGRYHLAITIRLDEYTDWTRLAKPGAAGVRERKWPHPFWTGTITTRPVEFEIAAKGGAAAAE